MTLTPEQRAEIAATRATRPKMSRAEVEHLATKYGVSPRLVIELRRKYAQEHDVPPAHGRPPKTTAEQERMAFIAFRLRRVIKQHTIACRQGVTDRTIQEAARRYARRHGWQTKLTADDVLDFLRFIGELREEA